MTMSHINEFIAYNNNSIYDKNWTVELGKSGTLLASRPQIISGWVYNPRKNSKRRWVEMAWASANCHGETIRHTWQLEWHRGSPAHKITSNQGIPRLLLMNLNVPFNWLIFVICRLDNQWSSSVPEHQISKRRSWPRSSEHHPGQPLPSDGSSHHTVIL